MKNLKKNGGFTLIEILVVIGIIAILAVIVLIAINPARQFAQARDTQRTSNVNAILNAVGQFMADNKGDIPAVLDGDADETIDAALLCDDTDPESLVPTYLPAMPTDPDSALEGGDLEAADCDGGQDDTDYIVSRDSVSGRITVSAVGEITDPIEVTR